ncbi:hypothetical protein V494_02347, partial [Pseudogymnoascus sp. VKM F-4513 (FW-928)]
MPVPAHEQPAVSIETDVVEVEAARDDDVEGHRDGSVKSQQSRCGRVVEMDDSYLRASSFTKFWRSVLFQMLLFGA